MTRRKTMPLGQVPKNFRAYLEGLRNPFGCYRATLAQLADRYEPGLVSIIIPCFNNGPYVRQAIDSALEQPLDAAEVIVIDDGSTDDSLTVIKSYGSRIVWRSKENAGANAARNDGLELAQGEFIQFLDADDVLLNGGIASRLSAFDANIDAVFGDRDFIDKNGTRTGRSRRYAEFGWPPNDIPAFLCSRTSIQTSEVLHRRSHLYTAGGFDDSVPRLQDTEFHLRLYLSGHQFKHIPEKVVLIREHQGESRITNTKFYSNDKEQLRKVGICFLAVAAEKAPDRISNLFRDVIAWLIEENSRVAARNGNLGHAWRLIREAQLISPGGTGNTLNAHRIGRIEKIAIRTFGYWRALRLWTVWQSLVGSFR